MKRILWKCLGSAFGGAATVTLLGYLSLQAHFAFLGIPKPPPPDPVLFREGFNVLLQILLVPLMSIADLARNILAPVAGYPLLLLGILGFLVTLWLLLRVPVVIRRLGRVGRILTGSVKRHLTLIRALYLVLMIFALFTIFASDVLDYKDVLGMPLPTGLGGVTSSQVEDQWNRKFVFSRTILAFGLCIFGFYLVGARQLLRSEPPLRRVIVVPEGGDEGPRSPSAWDWILVALTLCTILLQAVCIPKIYGVLVHSRMYPVAEVVQDQQVDLGHVYILYQDDSGFVFFSQHGGGVMVSSTNDVAIIHSLGFRDLFDLRSEGG